MAAAQLPEPIWVSGAVAIAIHGRQIAEHGGTNGIRDPDLLDSALARPRNAYAYEPKTTTIFSLAACYCVAIVSNHPFVDGNKRSGLTVMLTFLALNSWQIEQQEDEHLTVIGVADGELDEAQLTAWVQSHAVPVNA